MRVRSIVCVVLVLALLIPVVVSAAESTPVAGTPVATPASLAGVAPLPLTGERQVAWAAYITEMLERTAVPGAAVAVVQNGEVVFAQGFGVRELGSAQPVTPDTLMMIGSVTKSMTATMAATVIDDGDLTWDTPVVEELPAFAVADPELTQHLTIRNAFCACTGMPQRDADFIFHSDDLPPEALIASVADVPLAAPLGELYQYSNQMFAIGGYAATVAAGGHPDDLYGAYTEAVQQRLLNPLGMTRSTFELQAVTSSGDYAVPHGRHLGGAYQTIALEDEDSFVTAVAPAGALWSSAADMAGYLQMELSGGIAPDGNRVVSTENLEATWQPQVAMPGDWAVPPEMGNLAEHYGLGWVLGDYFGQPLIWHNGGTFGFSAQFAFLPEADLGIVILTNGAGADLLTWAIQYRLLEMLFARPHAVDAVVAQVLEGMDQQMAGIGSALGAVDAEAVTPYLGTYQSDRLGDVDIVLEDGTLIFDIGELQSEIVTMPGAAGDVEGYVLADPPLMGVPVSFRAEGETPEMTVADPATGEELVLSRVSAD